jgi:hypothetical protein
MADYGEWTRKGAVLRDLTAQKQYGVSQDFIVQGIKSGKLEFRTAYLENGGTLEKARQMAAHASTRTTQLYDRREDRVTLDEVVKINI